MSMRIYVAGPMTGVEMFNHPAFDAAAARLRAMGHDVYNPAEIDRVHGIDPKEPAKFGNAERRRAMRWDTACICSADAIALLPGWENSGGVAVELALAKYLGLKVLDAETGLERATAVVERDVEVLKAAAERADRALADARYTSPESPYSLRYMVRATILNSPAKAERAA